MTTFGVHQTPRFSQLHNVFTNHRKKTKTKFSTKIFISSLRSQLLLELHDTGNVAFRAAPSIHPSIQRDRHAQQVRLCPVHGRGAEHVFPQQRISIWSLCCPSRVSRYHSRYAPFVGNPCVLFRATWNEARNYATQFGSRFQQTELHGEGLADKEMGAGFLLVVSNARRLWK